MPSTWTPQQQISDMPTVTREVVIDTAQQIADLLHAEFVLVPVSHVYLLSEQCWFDCFRRNLLRCLLLSYDNWLEDCRFDVDSKEK